MFFNVETQSTDAVVFYFPLYLESSLLTKLLFYSSVKKAPVGQEINTREWRRDELQTVSTALGHHGRPSWLEVPWLQRVAVSQHGASRSHDGHRGPRHRGVRWARDQRPSLPAGAGGGSRVHREQPRALFSGSS